MSSFILTQYFIALLTTGIINFSLGILVISKGFKKRLNQIFALYSFSLFLWSVFEALGITSYNESLALLLWRINHIGVIFIPVFLTHFIFLLLDIQGNKRKLIPISYAIACFFLILDATPLLILEVVPKFSFRYFINPGYLYYTFFWLWIGWAVYANLELFKEYFRTTGHRRTQMKYFCWSLLFSYIGGVPNFFPTFNIEIPILMPFATYAIPLYALFAAYAITKHRLMDIRVVINRAAAWILTVVILGSIYLGLIQLYRAYVSLQTDLFFLIWSIFYGIFVGETFQRIRLHLQTTSEKLILKGKYDYYKVLAEVASKITEKFGTKNILETLYSVFTNDMEVSTPRVLLPEDYKVKGKPSKAFVEFDKEGQRKPDGLSIKKSSEAYAYLERHDKYLMLEEIKDKLTLPSLDEEVVNILKSMTKTMEREKIEILIPCIYKDKIQAMIIIGKKLSEDPFTEEDLSLLKILASQTAIAIDSTRTYEEVYEDLQKAQTEIERVTRLASLGTLSAGLAHTIRNPMAAVSSLAEQIPQRLEDKPFLIKMSKIIPREMFRIVKITKQMLQFTKQGVSEKQLFSVNKVIKDVLVLLESDLKMHEVKVKVNSNCTGQIRGSALDITDAIMNFIINAKNAMPNGGQITITTSEVKAPNIKGIPTECVQITIEDTGIGIAKENLENVFDPFFTTRAEGIGLGLSIVHKTITKDHLGTIGVESEVGKGTKFTIRIPLSKVKPENILSP